MAVAASRAVANPGTEVAPAEVGGQARGVHGRWAMIRRRLRPTVAVPEADPVRDGDPVPTPAAETPEAVEGAPIGAPPS